ncbi:UDP-N-acetylmuramate--L-alanine ligase [Piscirickettsia salmonis]|uniref:UDP-N-acetylmuramate--L-alanine ligase n=1 Tax=Piscirickettsia salmonis TaxID=1238 RepID=UPI000F0873E6
MSRVIKESNPHHLAMRRIRRIHFIGAGGVGMAGIAEVLYSQGYVITGSDIVANTLTERLKTLGAQIFLGHHASHVEGADVVVVSSAVAEDNPEVVFAHQLHIPVVGRAQMLAELMRFSQGVAVAGTHGKTTTTSLIASILSEGELNPTFVIGGQLNSTGANAVLGSGCYFVAEADESDASFLHLNPTIAVVTNIDQDHMPTYQGEVANLKQTFLEFVHSLPFYGLAVLCIDDMGVRELLGHISCPTVTYGFHEDADYRITDFYQTGLTSHFRLLLPDQEELYLELNLPGIHNVQNAVAAIAVALDCGVCVAAIQRALQQFAGVGRRFQVYGPFDLPVGKITLVDDYGHHPCEIKMTLQAARDAWPSRRIVHVFQPHRYTRTRDLFNEFVEALKESDFVVLMEVHAAGEALIQGATATALFKSIQRKGVNIVLVRNEEQLEQTLCAILRDQDILLLQGAGSIGSVAKNFAKNKLDFLYRQLAGAAS